MLKKGLICGMAVLALGMLDAIAETAPAVDGATVARNCYICHGTFGISPDPIPDLMGMSEADIQQALLEFKSGQREATIMDRIAKGYSDEQIAAVAAYLAGLR
jgi:cytochrome subunit of sulfide dehydrogenase